MNLPDDLLYSESHEWVRRDPNGIVTVGITDHAQAALGDLVFIEMPAPGRHVGAREACAVVESVKAASDVYAPIAGEITERNDALSATPEKVNEDPYGAWLFKIRYDHETSLDGLLSPADYRKMLDVA
jgi:glycine cleavage system H protein